MNANNSNKYLSLKIIYFFISSINLITMNIMKNVFECQKQNITSVINSVQDSLHHADFWLDIHKKNNLLLIIIIINYY